MAAPAFAIAESVERAVEGRPYERRPGDPLYRPLRIFALDPAASRLEGSIAVVNVPYEPIGPGFRGTVFEVDAHDEPAGAEYRSLALDELAVALANGRSPSPSDPLFHQQMVYAVCMLVYGAFRAALGRHLAWGFARNGHGAATRLRLRPYALEAANAYYDPEAGALCFGYCEAPDASVGRTPPHGLVFTSLSHDIVAHEVTHALVDGLRAHFVVPSGPDVLAFHEGFADLVAIFQRFTYRPVVEEALGASRGRLEQASLLGDLARQFGQTLGTGGALRSAIDPSRRRVYRRDLEEHALGSVLVSAVFDAFTTVFARKSRRYLRLATGGTGTLPAGEIPADLRAILADEASKLAAQFLSICIRAVDYCPPVDLELGEFLRAVVTADHELVPDDPWAYREAWIDAFRCRAIFPPGVRFLSEDALLWKPPAQSIEPVGELTFAELRFAGDPAWPAGATELRRQAEALGRFVTRDGHRDAFGLAPPGDHGGDTIALPHVHSIRSSRRVGPDGQVVFDLVAEVTQVRRVQPRGDVPGFDFIGGATIIIGPDGGIRYVVSKRVLNDQRLEEQRRFLASERGRRLWAMENGRLAPRRQPFMLVHGA